MTDPCVFVQLLHPTNQSSHCAVMNRWELKVGGFEVSGRNLLKDQLLFAPAHLLFMVAGLKAKAQQGSDPGKSSYSTGSVARFNCMRSLVILLLWFCPFSQSSCRTVALIAISQLVTLAGPRERQLDSAACQEVEDPLPSCFPMLRNA